MRRLHDLDLSGLWVLGAIGGLIVLGGWAVILFALLEGQSEAAVGGAVIVMAIVYVVYIAFLIWLLCRRGTFGPNRFGDDPLRAAPLPSFNSGTQSQAYQATFTQPRVGVTCGNCGAKLVKSVNFCPKCGVGW